MEAAKLVHGPFAVSHEPSIDFKAEMNRSLFDSAYQMGDSKYAYIPISAMTVDVEHAPYQRELKSVLKLCDEWDSKKLDPLVVSYRDDTFVIIDGQHRFEAAKKIGMTHLPCRILTGMSVVDEAKYFAHQDDRKQKLTVYQKFYASLVAKDELSIRLKTICDKHGIVISAANSVKSGCLGSIVHSIEYIESDEEWFEQVLCTLSKAGWDNRRYGLSDMVVGALFDLKRYEFMPRGMNYHEINFTMSRLAEYLKPRDPEYFCRMTQREAIERGEPRGLGRTIPRTVSAHIRKIVIGIIDSRLDIVGK